MNLNKLKVSTKILIPVIFVAILGNFISNYISTSQMHKLANENTEKSLNMLTSSIFLTLRTAMNTGDPTIIKDAENKSREDIKGLESLVVAKSKETIEMYSPGSKFTSDKNIIEVFDSKTEKSFDLYKGDDHFYRVIKPMLATQDCILCHANQKVGDVIGVIDLSFSLNDTDELISNSSNFLLIVAIIIIVIILSVILFIVKKVTNSLKTLQDDLEMFFQFLTKQRDTIEPFKINSMDEIGEMISSINDNIEKTIIGIKNDSEAIKQSSEICSLASKGDLSVQINARTNNEEINNLIDIVNRLLSSMNYNINRVLVVLDKYSQDHFSAKINSKGNTTAEMKKLFDQVNILGDTLSKVSSQNLKNGLALEQTSGVLSKNVDQLTNVLTKESESLSNISEDLNLVTNKINETSDNSVEMSAYAKRLAISSNEGKELASKTASSMQVIDEQVTAINEAITVIDQISFQTNILSLNAAVEAATAGEAGKGFAVVAQEVRNLASRSADAAKQIKDLVENAKNKADDGKEIASSMTEGYDNLNKNIESTTNLINLVTNNSKEQQDMINNINSSIQDINIETKKNVNIAKETNIVAHQASDIAHIIVVDASDKNFEGKSNIKIRKKITDVKFNGPERRKVEGRLKKGEEINRR